MKTSQFPILKLRPAKERSILLKHPWIFSGAIQSEEKGIQEGDIVEVADAQGNYLATGHFHHGSIKVRVFSFQQTTADQSFWEQKFQHAYRLRESLGLTHSSETNAYRLIHGEGDGFPGLIVDIYHTTAVMQAHTPGMYKLIDLFASCLKKLFGDRLVNIYDKSSQSLGNHASMSSGDRFLLGEASTERIKESNVLYEVNHVEGQKTGFFLDQRDNRSLLRSYAQQKSVLNTCCYSGGFSMAAAAGGASTIVSIDSSSKATALAEINSGLNRVKNHEIITDDVFDFLKKDDRMFDIVVLDPPAFAKHLNAVDKAMIGYRNLNTAGFRKVNPGGLLFTFSCSQVVDKTLFRKVVFQAAAQSGRNVRILHQLSQGADHPISIYHPEGEYLKGLVLYVD